MARSAFGLVAAFLARTTFLVGFRVAGNKASMPYKLRFGVANAINEALKKSNDSYNIIGAAFKTLGGSSPAFSSGNGSRPHAFHQYMNDCSQA